jgi:hypothetical protein
MNPRALALACFLACAAADAALADNLVPNWDFDLHVVGWKPASLLSAKMAFAPLDEKGSTGSGSLRLYDLAPGAYVGVFSSCFPIEGGEPIVYGGSAYAPGAEVPQSVRASLYMYDDPACGGSGSAWPNDVSASTGMVTWGTSQGTVVPAASRKAARLHFFLNAAPTPAPEVYIDNAFAHQGQTCQPTNTIACLGGGRFRTSIDWEIPSGERGRARMKSFEKESDSAYATFFDPSNVEVVLKVLDGRGLNGHFWVFVTGLTNVGTTVRVRDTVAGETWSHVTEVDEPFQPVLDTEAIEAELVEMD